MSIIVPDEYKYIDLRELAPHEDAKAVDHMQVAENLQYLWTRDGAFLGGQLWDPAKTDSANETALIELTPRIFGGRATRLDASGDVRLRMACHIEYAVVEATVNEAANGLSVGTMTASQGAGKEWAVGDVAIPEADLTDNGNLQPLYIRADWRGDGAPATRSIRQIAFYERRGLGAADIP